jgi:ribulose kinase
VAEHGPSSGCFTQKSADGLDSFSQPLKLEIRNPKQMHGHATIDTVLLVGGSTRMPMVAKMLEEVSGKQPERSISPDEAVAHGTALYANLLLQKQDKQSAPPARLGSADRPPQESDSDNEKHSAAALSHTRLQDAEAESTRRRHPCRRRRERAFPFTTLSFSPSVQSDHRLQ